MNERKALNGKRLVSTDIKAAEVVQPSNRNEQKLEKQNITLHGCRQNCRECCQEEAEWEPKIEQKEIKRG